jgi:opacity protein-like surface antigen
MHLKSPLLLTFVVLIACAAFSSFAQTPPAAKGIKTTWSFAIGAGFSGFNPDYDHGQLYGGTLWIDYFPTRLPARLNGLGVEVAARDLNYGRSALQPPNLREDVGEGGVIYSYPHFRIFRPYAKLFMGFGNTDETAWVSGHFTGKRYNDSRTITSFGGGVDFHAVRHIWLRADYEYQRWPDFFKHTNPATPAGLLNPQGFTIGAMYHF